MTEISFKKNNYISNLVCTTFF